MTGEEIINKFHTYTDDQSELSSQEELDLLNNIYQDVYRYRHWEWLKTQKSGTLDSFTSSDSHITLPADFIAFAENANSTDNTEEYQGNASPKVIYIIDSFNNYVPFQIVNFSDRRRYLNQKGFAYLDLKNSKIVFTAKPDYSSYEFDYIAKPTALGLSDQPVFDSDFHQVLVHGMAIDHEIIQLFDRAHSYAPENRQKYQDYLDAMAFDNAEKLLN